MLDYQAGLLWNHVDSTWALLAAFGIKLHLLPFSQGFETTGLDGGMMDKHIITTVGRSNESETFTIVKPLNCTCIYTGYLYILINNELADSLMLRNFGRVC